MVMMMPRMDQTMMINRDKPAEDKRGYILCSGKNQQQKSKGAFKYKPI